MHVDPAPPPPPPPQLTITYDSQVQQSGSAPESHGAILIIMKFGNGDVDLPWKCVGRYSVHIYSSCPENLMNTHTHYIIHHTSFATQTHGAGLGVVCMVMAYACLRGYWCAQILQFLQDRQADMNTVFPQSSVALDFQPHPLFQVCLIVLETFLILMHFLYALQW